MDILNLFFLIFLSFSHILLFFFFLAKESCQKNDLIKNPSFIAHFAERNMNENEMDAREQKMPVQQQINTTTAAHKQSTET